MAAVHILLILLFIGAMFALCVKPIDVVDTKEHVSVVQTVSGLTPFCQPVSTYNMTSGPATLLESYDIVAPVEHLNVTENLKEQALLLSNLPEDHSIFSLKCNVKSFVLKRNRIGVLVVSDDTLLNTHRAVSPNFDDLNHIANPVSVFYIQTKSPDPSGEISNFIWHAYENIDSTAHSLIEEGVSLELVRNLVRSVLEALIFMKNSNVGWYSDLSDGENIFISKGETTKFYLPKINYEPDSAGEEWVEMALNGFGIFLKTLNDYSVRYPFTEEKIYMDVLINGEEATILRGDLKFMDFFMLCLGQSDKKMTAELLLEHPFITGKSFRIFGLNDLFGRRSY